MRRVARLMIFHVPSHSSPSLRHTICETPPIFTPWKEGKYHMTIQVFQYRIERVKLAHTHLYQGAFTWTFNRLGYWSTSFKSQFCLSSWFHVYRSIWKPTMVSKRYQSMITFAIRSHSLCYLFARQIESNWCVCRIFREITRFCTYSMNKEGGLVGGSYFEEHGNWHIFIAENENIVYALSGETFSWEILVRRNYSSTKFSSLNEKFVIFTWQKVSPNKSKSVFSWSTSELKRLFGEKYLDKL